ncbi:MAG TPA: serine/threonine-protein kinase, partial [Acidimicrobiales bacterium]|nr:serine/threonine-protein kinase [Acidimicrobiales bacterium]
MAETTRWRPVGRLRPGDPHEVAGFEVAGRLGEGGMGVVYLADHPDLGRAALKLVRDGAVDASFRARFRREVAAAERVRSPRVAEVLAADPDAATPWLATAFVDGPTVAEAVDTSSPMTGDRLVALAVALADALAAIHRVDVVHRDLKPANILLTPETPVVIDFGIAALREAPALTRTGVAVGTPGWMAPEQVRGLPCGPPADVFAWALVVAFAASGRPVFGRGPADALFYRIVHEPPDVPDLPPELAGPVRAALDKDPAARPGVAHLLADLKRLTRARRTTPPLAPFPAACLAHETPAHLDQSEAVFQALAQFLHDSLAAERVTLAGAVRIVLHLLADLCAMLTHQYGHTAAEVEARIDRL